MLDMEWDDRTSLRVMVQTGRLENQIRRGHRHCIQASKETVEIEDVLYHVPGTDEVGGLEVFRSNSSVEKFLLDVQAAPPRDGSILAVGFEGVGTDGASSHPELQEHVSVRRANLAQDAPRGNQPEPLHRRAKIISEPYADTIRCRRVVVAAIDSFQQGMVEFRLPGMTAVRAGEPTEVDCMRRRNDCVSGNRMLIDRLLWQVEQWSPVGATHRAAWLIGENAGHGHSMSSQRSGSPRARSRRARRPTTWGKLRGGNPMPGRIARTCSGPIVSPATSGRTMKRDRACSAPGRRVRVNTSASPSACQVWRTERTRCANSSGSSENSASGPPSALDRVKCFSNTTAPRATAATAARSPRVWSESPTAQPKAASRSSARRFMSATSAGYCETQCSSAKSRQPASRRIRSDS